MLLSNQQQLEDLIVLLLAKKERRSALQIQQALKKKYDVCATIQGIYRVLRSLQKTGVVVKEKQLYSLNMSWVLTMGDLANQMEQVYFQEHHLYQLLPDPMQKKRKWHFRTLYKAADFWGQLLVAMAYAAPSPRIALNYSPHIWYELLVTRKEQQFVHSYHKLIDREYVIVGHRTKYDKESGFLPDRETEVIYYAQPEERIEKNDAHYIDVIGEYVFRVTLPNDIVERIHALYQKETAPTTHEILSLLQARTRVRIQVTHDPAKARLYYKKFEKIFGPLDKPLLEGKNMAL